ncbi:MAG: LPS export ABC transporter periplasmic protein LptC [Treponema sp.]|jgi:LPS export ABC transporter protein LptC|nr:LPS export ABC transporter periplasmic protein LptC [Treponema sp.]
MKKNAVRFHVRLHVCFCLVFLILLAGCTFDYGDSESTGEELPDLIMENVEYVRVRSADPIARFMAERAERYDRQRIMKLQNFSFEQYGERGNEVNAFGKAGSASVDIETSDIYMDHGVRIEVESEDIIIETAQLEWKDEDRILSTGKEEEVNISQNKGTGFTGIGLIADARNRTWEFLGGAGGTYVYEDDDEENAAPDDEDK